MSSTTALSSRHFLSWFAQVETAWEVYQQMKSAGFKPDEYTYNILINGCTHEKKLSTAFELVDTMRQDGLSPNVVTFNTLLKVWIDL